MCVSWRDPRDGPGGNDKKCGVEESKARAARTMGAQAKAVSASFSPWHSDGAADVPLGHDHAPPGFFEDAGAGSGLRAYASQFARGAHACSEIYVDDGDDKTGKKLEKAYCIESDAVSNSLMPSSPYALYWMLQALRMHEDVLHYPWASRQRRRPRCAGRPRCT